MAQEIRVMHFTHEGMHFYNVHGFMVNYPHQTNLQAAIGKLRVDGEPIPRTPITYSFWRGDARIERTFLPFDKPVTNWGSEREVTYYRYERNERPNPYKVRLPEYYPAEPYVSTLYGNHSRILTELGEELLPELILDEDGNHPIREFYVLKTVRTETIIDPLEVVEQVELGEFEPAIQVPFRWKSEAPACYYAPDDTWHLFPCSVRVAALVQIVGKEYEAKEKDKSNGIKNVYLFDRPNELDFSVYYRDGGSFSRKVGNEVLRANNLKELAEKAEEYLDELRRQVSLGHKDSQCPFCQGQGIVERHKIILDPGWARIRQAAVDVSYHKTKANIDALLAIIDAEKIRFSSMKPD